MKALIVDPRLAGCSGDMFLSAFINLIDNNNILDEVILKINQLFQTGLEVKTHIISKKGIKSTHLELKIDQDIKIRHATEIADLMDKLMINLDITVNTKKLANSMLNALFQAESAVHNTPIEKLHLHETASIDTILDIAGTAYIIEKAGLSNVPILGLPVNTGSGFINIAHGTVSVPPPAVLEILKNSDYTFFSDNVKGELLTPTGVAILATIVSKQITDFPPITISKIGYGAGTKELESRANVLRLILADIPDEESKHYLTMLETHLDDVSGEILGGIVSNLLEMGALDVSYYPLIMKKNRPGWTLRIICDDDKSSELALYVMKELGTLGVREKRFARYELERRIVEKKVIIDNKEYICRYKERILNNEIIGAKPEYEDLAKISKELKIPIIELEKELLRQYEGYGDLE